MTASKIAGYVVPSLFIGLLAIGGQRPAAAVAPAYLNSQASCSLADVALAKARFESMAAYRRYRPDAVSMDAVRAASDVYITLAEACYDELYGHPTESIDEGGLWLTGAGVSSYALFGTKWGAGTPYASIGVDENGPRIAGGVVTYSFMASGIGGLEAEGAPGGTVTTAVSAMPTFNACFTTEIANAFAAWSAVANITFSQVADGGQPFNDPAATSGMIRIAGHPFDGASGVLAHAFFPPPNGATAAGDLHFDIAENWNCATGGGLIDIGIVTAHEVGHAIGLNHETRSAGRPALMNPFYNPAIASGLLGDDINGGEQIYGSSVAGVSPDALIDFGAPGLWRLNYGIGFSQIHTLNPEQVVTGDLDGNGIDDIIVDFGAAFGVWKLMNNTTWSQVHTLSPTFMAVGDLDNNGDEDLVINFAGAGLWRYMNGTTFSQIHALNPTVFAIGRIDNSGGDDIVMTFAGAGTWQFRNNTTFSLMHSLDATQIIIADFDEQTGTGDEAEDIILAFPGFGIWAFLNVGNASPPAPVQVHSIIPARMAAGDMNGNGRDELVADFGPGVGIYVFEGFVGWSPSALITLTTQDIRLGDLDGNGQWELLADFGASGLWAYVNNTTWVSLHPANIEGMTIGDLN